MQLLTDKRCRIIQESVTMNSSSRTEIRKSGVYIPDLCFGTSALGNMPDTYTYKVGERRAVDTLKAILTSSSPFIDASRNYGMGRSEERIGLAIKELGGLPDTAVISTKLDRNMDSLLFDAAQARQSLEESLSALGVDRVDILHLHDPEHAGSFEPVTRTGGAIDELFKMRDEGLCRVVGLAAGNVEVMMPLLKDYDFDALITHNRFTLVNANAEKMIAFAHDKNIAVLNAAPYCGGALAKGTASFKRYVYQAADATTLAPLKVVEEICNRHHVPPGAAALQYSLRDPRIAATICGVSKPERVEQTQAWADYHIPDYVWQELSEITRTTDDPEATRNYSPG